MDACQACGSTRVHQGRCLRCGAAVNPQIVVGQPAPAPQTWVTGEGLVLTELEPLEEEPAGPELEGFEGTRLEAEGAPIRRKKEEEAPPVQERATFEAQICPMCGSDLPHPTPPFCDHCGNRLPRAKRADPAAQGEKKRCRQCGFRNDPTRAVCVNCGQRI